MSRSMSPQNNRDLNQGFLHIWSIFSDPSFNGWWVIAHTSKCLPQTQTQGRIHRQTDTGNDNTRRPKLALGKNGPWKFMDVGALTVIFHARSWKMWKKIGQNFVFGDYEKTRNFYWLTCLDLFICQIWWNKCGVIIDTQFYSLTRFSL